MLFLLGTTWKFSKTVRNIIYRADGRTLYHKYNRVPKAPDPDVEKVSAKPQAKAKSGAARAMVDEDQQALLLNQEAFRAFRSAVTTGVYYSVPKVCKTHAWAETSELSLVPVHERLQHEQRHSVAALPSWLQEECNIGSSCTHDVSIEDFEFDGAEFGLGVDADNIATQRMTLQTIYSSQC